MWPAGNPWTKWGFVAGKIFSNMGDHSGFSIATFDGIPRASLTLLIGGLSLYRRCRPCNSHWRGQTCHICNSGSCLCPLCMPRPHAPLPTTFLTLKHTTLSWLPRWTGPTPLPAPPHNCGSKPPSPLTLRVWAAACQTWWVALSISSAVPLPPGAQPVSGYSKHLLSPLLLHGWPSWPLQQLFDKCWPPRRTWWPCPDAPVWVKCIENSWVWSSSLAILVTEIRYQHVTYTHTYICIYIYIYIYVYVYVYIQWNALCSSMKISEVILI